LIGGYSRKHSVFGSDFGAFGATRRGLAGSFGVERSLETLVTELMALAEVLGRNLAGASLGIDASILGFDAYATFRNSHSVGECSIGAQ
jgi:hypothetical protein